MTDLATRLSDVDALDAEIAGLDALEFPNAPKRSLGRRIWSATWPKLAAIAIAPLVPALAKHWEHPRNQLLWSLLLGVPVTIGVLLAGRGDLVTVAVVEYLQFIALLFALFVVSGGIFLRGDIAATPRTNTIFLAVGGVLASFIGTTGAAMLLIRPLLNTNAERRHTAHTVVFTILIVANCGGLLTPLGDPPLFLGFLKGVDFFWTVSHILPETLFLVGWLLAIFFALDSWYYHRREETQRFDPTPDSRAIGFDGARNFWLLAAVVVLVLLSGVCSSSRAPRTPREPPNMPTE